MGGTIFLAALFGTAAAALWKGSRLERLTAAGLVAASFGTLLADRAVAGTFVRPELGVALLDIALLLFLVEVMRRSDKFWPIWAVGFHSISVAAHVVVLVMPDFLRTPYALYSGWWALPVVLALLAGCFERGCEAAVSRS